MKILLSFALNSSSCHSNSTSCALWLIQFKFTLINSYIQSFEAQNCTGTHNYEFLLRLPHAISSLTDWLRDWTNHRIVMNYISHALVVCSFTDGSVYNQAICSIDVMPEERLIVCLYLVCCLLINNSGLHLLMSVMWPDHVFSGQSLCIYYSIPKAQAVWCLQQQAHGFDSQEMHDQIKCCLNAVEVALG